MPAVLSGVGVSAGVAAGPVARMAPPPQIPHDVPNSGDPAAESTAAHEALEAVASQLEARAARAVEQGAGVLAAQAMMARDPGLADKVTAATAAGRAAVLAVMDAFGDYRAMLAAAGPYMAERVADLDDLASRTVAVLLGVPMPGVPDPGHPYVLVADDLAPADTATLDPASVLAIITERGGPTSHTAILAKSMGIPAVVACPQAEAVTDGQRLLVEGAEGRVWTDPDEATVSQAFAEREAQRAAEQA